jgi:Protein kinase domain
MNGKSLALPESRIGSWLNSQNAKTLSPTTKRKTFALYHVAMVRTEMIGQGAYGIVYQGTKVATGEKVAIKRIPFADSTPEGGVPCNVIREISLLRELNHPNVVRFVYAEKNFACYFCFTLQCVRWNSNTRLVASGPVILSFAGQAA